MGGGILGFFGTCSARGTEHNLDRSGFVSGSNPLQGQPGPSPGPSQRFPADKHIFVIKINVINTWRCVGNAYCGIGVSQILEMMLKY